MNQLRDQADRYAAVLRHYLAEPNEADLSSAYEFGRQALGDGLGVLDLAMLHHASLSPGLSAASPAQFLVQLNRAAEFLAETLSPFEMSLRGYRDTNAQLLALNEMLQQAKAATEAVNAELEAFSYSVAHDLRAPLRSIDGFSQALLEDYGEKLPGQGQDYLRRVRTAAQRMGELIDGLLTLSRVGRADLQRVPTDIATVARSIVAQLQQTSPTRKVAFSCPEELVVEGDPVLLRAMLENLLGNAWKFTANKEQATIEIGAIDEPEQRVFFVRDNGAGFDMSYADRLFGAFQRLHSTSEFEGTGIGLATVRRIVHRHGGRIWAEGEVGNGAAFFWTLPGPADGEKP